MPKENCMSDGRICIAMSGGVDSSVAAMLLAGEGVDCIGATMTLGVDADEENVAYARQACSAIGIPHEVFLMEDAFESQVIEPFKASYAAGLTPNPCVECNMRIKFDAFAEMAHALGCDMVATGHYCCLEHGSSGTRLLKARDPRKDQTYFLSRVPLSRLTDARFPLGGMTKREVKRIAEDSGLPCASRTESQDICFINGSSNDFLKDALGMRPGRILDADGNDLGGHDGAYLFTEGQRKGLGVALGYPAYVIGKDIERNQVILGKMDDAMNDSVKLTELNVLSPDLVSGTRCQAKLRYRMEPVACTISVGGDSAELALDDPCVRPAPGQTAALYLDDLVLGGAKII